MHNEDGGALTIRPSRLMAGACRTYHTDSRYNEPNPLVQTSFYSKRRLCGLMVKTPPSDTSCILTDQDPGGDVGSIPATGTPSNKDKTRNCQCDQTWTVWHDEIFTP